MRLPTALCCLALLASAADEDLPALVAKLGHPDAAVRTEAAAALERAGRDAVPALRAALEKAEDPEVRANLAALIERLDWPEPGPAHEGLRLTLKLETKETTPGGRLAGRVRLRSEAAAAKTLKLFTEQPPGPADFARSIRLVVVDAKGNHRAVGEFLNLNRGPDPLVLEVARGSVATAPVRAFAGCHLAKGDDRQELPPGEYRVYAVLGDALGGWDRTKPPPLRSNQVRVKIVAPDGK